MEGAMRLMTVALLATVLATGCQGQASARISADEFSRAKAQQRKETPNGLKSALFAGGCFWCMQPPFDKAPGVVKTIVGYAGGPETHPTYKQVAYGRTGHTEAILVVYDPRKTTFEKLLDVYWRSMDPTDSGGQFADRGKQYRSTIFYYSDVQRKTAEASKATLQKSKRFGEKRIVVPIVAATRFWKAETYHQKYYKKNYAHYARYREGSGRGPFLRRIWAQK
jgi:methionine-S-sulfoxide reductase